MITIESQMGCDRALKGALGLTAVSLLIIVFVLLSTYLGNDNHSPTASFYQGATHEKYCIKMLPERSVGLRSKFWTKDTITYRYINKGHRFEPLYENWLRIIEDSTRLVFVEVDGYADTRVELDDSGEAWSYLGNDALKIHQDSTTTKVGFIEYQEDDERVIPHELVIHKLGWAHTQLSIHNVFNRLKYKSWRMDQGWTEQQVDNFFEYKDYLDSTGDAVYYDSLDWKSLGFYHYPDFVFANPEIARKNNSNKLNYKMSDYDWWKLKHEYGRRGEPVTERTACFTESKWREITGRQTTEFSKLFELFAE